MAVLNPLAFIQQIIGSVTISEQPVEVDGTVLIGDQPVEVEGTVSVNQPVTVNGNVGITGAVTVAEPVTVDGTVSVTEPVTVDGNVGVTGTVDVQIRGSSQNLNVVGNVEATSFYAIAIVYSNPDDDTSLNCDAFIPSIGSGEVLSFTDRRGNAVVIGGDDGFMTDLFSEGRLIPLGIGTLDSDTDCSILALWY